MSKGRIGEFFQQFQNYDNTLIASTDIEGVRGSYDFSLIFWGLVAGDDVKLKQELIGWMGKWPKFEKFAQQAVGLHGGLGEDRVGRLQFESKTAFIDSLIELADIMLVSLINALLIPSEQLLQLNEKQTHSENGTHPPLRYVLFHEPEATRIKASLFKQDYQNTIIAIENHPGKDSLLKTVRLVKELNSLGVDAVLAFDIAHYYRELRLDNKDLTYKDIWEDVIQLLRFHGPVIVHLPVGPYLYDSIDIDQVTPEMWMELAKVNKEKGNIVVVEYQLADQAKRLHFDPLDKSTVGKNGKLVLSEDVKPIIDRARETIQMLQRYKVLNINRLKV